MLKTFNFAEWLSEGGNAGMRSFALTLSYEQMCWVRACVNRVATSASTAPLNFYEGKVGQLPTYKDKERIRDKEHPVYKLFNPPKPPTIISLKQLMYRTFVHEQIDGLVFWLIERKKGVATSIDIRTKNELRPITEFKKDEPSRAVLVGWESTSGKKYLPEDVLPIGNYDPRDQLSGLSLLKSARLSLESEYAIAGWNSSFFKTGMKSPLLIQAKGQLTKEQKSEIRKEIINYYSGIDGGHGALVMQGSVEVKPLTVNPKDIDFVRGKELNREEILAVFGVPPALVGIFAYANYCLTADALILLPNGSTKFITDIEPGDEVLSMGEDSIVSAKVVNCWEAGVKDIYQIKTSSRTVKCSPEHKFYKLMSGVGPTKPRRKEWVDAKDLYVGDYIAVVNGIPEFEGSNLLPNGMLATEGAMHQFGLFVGDGSVVYQNGKDNVVPYPQGVHIAIPDTDEDKNSYIEEARAFWVNAKGEPANVHRSKYVYSVYSVVASKWIIDFGFSGNSHTKRIPKWVFGLTVELKKAFLKGIFDSDGSYDKFGRVQIGLCNLALLNDIRDLCISVGYHVNNISSAMRTTNFGTFFLAAIVVSFGRGLDMNFKNHPLPDGLVWQKIRSIELLDPELTFDLEIEGTHNFFANWMVVHNSNVREQIRIFWEHTLLPKMNYILELLQFNILDRDFPGVYAAWDLSNVVGLAPDPNELAAPANIYKGIGYSASQISRILNCPALEPDKDFDDSVKEPAPNPQEVPVEPGKPKPTKPPKDPEAGDPKPSDKPKPDNNNQISELLSKRLQLFVESVSSDMSEHSIISLWDDLIGCFVADTFANNTALVKFVGIPKLFSKRNSVSLRNEFLENIDQLVSLIETACAPMKGTSSRQVRNFDYSKNQKPEQIFNLHTTINLPEGMVKSEPVEVIFQDKEPTKVDIHLQQPAQPAPVVNFYAEKQDPPVVNVSVSVPEQKTPEVTVNVPEQRAPDIHVNVPEQKTPEVTVNFPEINVNVPEQKTPEVTVNVPEQRAPDIHVNVPEQKTPEVTVHIPESNPIINLEVPVTPEIKVELGTRKTVTDIVRDVNGQISQATQIETSID